MCIVPVSNRHAFSSVSPVLRPMLWNVQSCYKKYNHCYPSPSHFLYETVSFFLPACYALSETVPKAPLNFLYMNTAAAWSLSDMQVLIHKSMYGYYKNQSHHPAPFLQIPYSLLFYTQFQKTSVSHLSDTDGYKGQTLSDCQCFLHLLLPVPE